MTFIPSVLAGKRILIVEDEAMIAFLIEEYLTDFGCIPVGPLASVAKALEAVKSEEFDVALLDVLLGGEKVYPVADALAERVIPFLFMSGYGSGANPPGHSERKICSKPFKAEDLAASLAAALAEAAPPPKIVLGVASLRSRS